MPGVMGLCFSLLPFCVCPKSEVRPGSEARSLTTEDCFPYNDGVGSRTGRSLPPRHVAGEESPNSAEQCAG
jgi:hypothetical protein